MSNHKYDPESMAILDDFAKTAMASIIARGGSTIGLPHIAYTLAEEMFQERQKRVLAQSPHPYRVGDHIK